MKIFDTNVMGNLRLLQTFHPMLARSSLKIALLMSSSEGSYYHNLKTQGKKMSGYRVSKAGLNMLGVEYAINPEVKKAGPRMIIMHPGNFLTKKH
jgi:NAD(P)-dependent dehydrogenase (short-subunit alcohol dehydrogenase family)